MPSTRASSNPLVVTLVSNNPATLQALEDYLRGAGVIARTTSHLSRLVDPTPPPSVAVILFPDDYRPRAVTAALVRLLRDEPNVLAVVVTDQPRRFADLSLGSTSRGTPLVIPKPAWAWTILDAVRARLEVAVVRRDHSW